MNILLNYNKFVPKKLYVLEWCHQIQTFNGFIGVHIPQLKRLMPLFIILLFSISVKSEIVDVDVYVESQSKGKPIELVIEGHSFKFNQITESIFMKNMETHIYNVETNMQMLLNRARFYSKPFNSKTSPIINNFSSLSNRILDLYYGKHDFPKILPLDILHSLGYKKTESIAKRFARYHGVDKYSLPKTHPVRLAINSIIYDLNIIEKQFVKRHFIDELRRIGFSESGVRIILEEIKNLEFISDIVDTKMNRRTELNIVHKKERYEAANWFETLNIEQSKKEILVNNAKLLEDTIDPPKSQQCNWILNSF